MKTYNRAKAVISLDAIAHNFAEMKKNLKSGTKIVAVIKADGYGHGAVEIAYMIHDYEYIWGFATATAEEAMQLRKAGIKKPIIILGLIFEEHYKELIQEEVRITVCDYSMAKELSEEAVQMNKTVHIHLALDTGMTRIGFSDTKESVDEIMRIRQLPNVEIEGLFTHFARADEYDRNPALIQLNRYLTFEALLRDAGIEIPLKHCSNSAGIMRVPESHLDMVRAGITIYGIYPSNEVERDSMIFQPAMELKSHVSFVKQVQPDVEISYGGTFVTKKTMTVATIPMGYADGYPRQLSSKGWVLIHGKRANILGRVCMDQFMVDVTDIPNVKKGDEVTLIGKDGDEFISIEEFGDLSGRFSYEFACEISKRVPRVYIKDGKEYNELTYFE